MKIEIRSIYGSVLFSGDFACLADCVAAAVKSRANLAYANLAGADLAGANLAGADLARAYLARADLAGAYLAGANLAGADLARADLARADLAGADLAGANLAGAKNADVAIAKTRILPEGKIIGWKKLREGTIAKLLIPAKAKRSHAFGRKCRASEVKVLAIYGANGVEVKTGHSVHDEKFRYVVGKTVKPEEPFSDDWQNECASGIHFFITRLEAEGCQ